MSDQLAEAAYAEAGAEALDAEARALMVMAHALRGLDRKAVDRVLKWAHDRFVQTHIVAGIELGLFQRVAEAERYAETLRAEAARLRARTGEPTHGKAAVGSQGTENTDPPPVAPFTS